MEERCTYCNGTGVRPGTEDGKTLKRKRLKTNITLREMARRLKVSPAYVSRVENGIDKPSKAFHQNYLMMLEC